MDIKIESPESKEALLEFVRFFDQVYEYRSARWPAPVDLHIPVLTGENPFGRDRTMRPLLARRGTSVMARAVAVIDERYQRHWRERLGHITMFEAMPDAHEATRLLMDSACEWLRERGAETARAGFGVLDFPFVIDDYESLPPELVRQNPHYYHRLLKDAGFESEKGWVDYKIRVRPELIEQWKQALESSKRRRYEIVPLKDVADVRRVPDFAATWRDTFKSHWGFAPLTDDEVSLLLQSFKPAGAYETSVIAYYRGTPVGMLFAVPEVTATAVVRPGRVLKDSEKLNILAIGVRESARGQGVNLAMAAYAYLELVRRGAQHLSYTLVLDDNWPSRRTAEKLGAAVCANYIVYRRNFGNRRGNRRSNSLGPSP
ncbi:MAG TPA: GNAT family N-acetyltransferase [Candidatus Eisenbacteria bacterium]|nr:GNAT family N-acetyltransferase [Candidatus Eisenbacteria bacterium]